MFERLAVHWSSVNCFGCSDVRITQRNSCSCSLFRAGRLQCFPRPWFPSSCLWACWCFHGQRVFSRKYCSSAWSWWNFRACCPTACSVPCFGFYFWLGNLSKPIWSPTTTSFASLGFGNAEACVGLFHCLGRKRLGCWSGDLAITNRPYVCFEVASPDPAHLFALAVSRWESRLLGSCLTHKILR